MAGMRTTTLPSFRQRQREEGKNEESEFCKAVELSVTPRGDKSRK
jgi:hypothetical protein